MLHVMSYLERKEREGERGGGRGGRKKERGELILACDTNITNTAAYHSITNVGPINVRKVRP